MDKQIHTFYIGNESLNGELLISIRDHIELNFDGKYLVLSEKERNSREQEIVSEYTVDALKSLKISVDGRIYYLYRKN